MFRKAHLFLLLATFCICFLMTWRMGEFDLRKHPVSTSNLRVLRDVIKKPLTSSRPVSQNQKKSTESMKLVETVSTPEPDLHVLTSEAQDSFYGKGCRVNPYRGRFQTILNEWRKMVERRNISVYFICFGSFLGSIRNGDLVPYDSDMDVCMFRREYHKLYPEESKRPVNLNDGKIHVLLQRNAPHPKSNTPRKDCRGNIVRHVADDCAILDPHGRVFLGALVYLDIFLIEDRGAQLWDEYRDKVHARDSMLPAKPCKYLGLDTYCPNNAEKYLNVYYGKEYMKPHHICKGGRWVQNMPGARRPFV